MKKIVLLLFICVFCSGCSSFIWRDVSETRKLVDNQAILMESYMTHINESTKEQDERALRNNAIAWKELNQIISKENQSLFMK